jgi:hypothetical protein
MNENMNEPYAEFVDLGTNRLMVFANRFEADGSISWSIGTTSGQNVGVQIGSNSQNALAELKQLKKAIDGAVKFHDNINKQNDAKGKNNDGVNK